MTSWSETSVQRKLMRMSLLATSGALFLAAVLLVVSDFHVYKTVFVERLLSLAEVISINASSAVVFNDRAAARETLSSLRARSSIRLAGIYRPDGTLFAHWEREGNPPPPPFPLERKAFHKFSIHNVIIYHPMVLDNAVIGMVFLDSDLSDLTGRLQRYALGGPLVLIFSLLVAVVIASRVGRAISEPILQLVNVSKSVSQNMDYSVRATDSGQDEIGLLVRTFNDMLNKIQKDGQALQKAHDELEQRVEERTTQLTAANKELEAFSYSVSHDLRSPLRAIDGFSRELLENSSESLDAQGRDDLQRIRAGAQRMSQLIDDLLNMSRLTRSEMTQQEVDLSQIADQTVQELCHSQPERKVEVTIDPGMKVFGSLPLLQVALENLLRNAWKFTSKRALAKIEFGYQIANAEKVYFVRDNGAGFDMSYADKLFGVFQRLHERAEFPGTGIGLATVQRIIHRHGGRIWAEATVDHGATFFFTLR